MNLLTLNYNIPGVHIEKSSLLRECDKVEMTWIGNIFRDVTSLLQVLYKVGCSFAVGEMQLWNYGW